MRICVITHDYPPHPGSRIATYAGAVARNLVAAGHEVHVVTNRAVHGATGLQDEVELWRDGNLTVHRLPLFDANGQPGAAMRFCELNTAQYPEHDRLWAHDLSNLVAAAIAGFVRSLHAVVGFDVIEVPEFYACAYYIVRQRRSGRAAAYPPVCLIAHGSTRESLREGGEVGELGRARVRERMLREEYCLSYADGLQTSASGLMDRYQEMLGDRLPACRRVIPYYAEVASGDDSDIARVAGSADSGAITAQKLELFAELVAAAERQARAVDDDGTLPGAGVVVIDATAVADELLAPTLESVATATRRAAAWRVVVLADDGVSEARELPSGWTRVAAAEALPWGQLRAAEHVVWVRAGARFDHGQMANLVELALATPAAAGSFAWLRPPNIQVFPFPQDGGFHDFLAEGSLVPAVLCLSAARLGKVVDLSSLDSPAARVAGLIAVATLASGASLLHTGSVDGDYYGDTHSVTPGERERALGLSEMLGLLPRELITTHSRSLLVTKAPPASAPAAEYQPHELQHLRQIHDEHMRLKNHRLVRMLRAMKVFDLARRVLPGAKKYVGPGRQG